MHGHHDDDHPFSRRWQEFEAMARRGFGRFAGSGGPGGEWRDWGDRFRIGKMMASGDLRLVALYLIEEKPRHGYELIKSIEERTEGAYVPSPGVIYPALTFLEEAGYASSALEGNKRAYSITEEGRTHLAANRAAVEKTLETLAAIGSRVRQMRDSVNEFEDRFRGGFPWGGEDRGRERDRDIPDVLPEVNEARRLLKLAITEAIGRGEASQRRLADILRRTAEEIGARDPDIDLG